MVSKTFIGRKFELEKLEAYLAEVLQRKKGNVTFITGEAGSGKTVLAKHFTTRVSKKYSEIRLAIAQCDSIAGKSSPFTPFFTLVDELIITEKEKGENRFFRFIENIGPDWVQAIPVVGGFISAGLKTLLWGRREFSSHSSFITSENIDQNTIFQQYIKILQNISELNPLLLVIDDLQWCDSSSCGLLFHLARNIENYPIFVIGTYRLSEIEATAHPMKQIRAEMDRYKICNEISLSRLSKENLIEYLNIEFPDNQFETSFIDFLDDKTDGHPLFIVEIINLLKEQKLIIQENNLWRLSQSINDIKIPTSVTGVINKRIDLLKDECKRILRYASIQGEKFTSVALSKLMNWQEIPLLEELDVLTKIHKLIEKLEMEGLIRKMGMRYQFIHSLIHQSFYDNLDKRQKELLHKKIGEILEEIYKDNIHDVSVDLAIHFEKGHVYDKAITYRLISAKKANTIYSCNEAIDHCKSALSIFEKIKDESKENIKKKIEILFELGRSKELTGEWNKAIEYYTECIALSRIPYVEKYKAEGFLRSGNIYSRQEKFADALIFLEQSISLYKKHSDFIGLARALRILGFIYRKKRGFSKAHEKLKESVEYSIKANNLEEKAESLREIAVLLGEQGKLKNELDVCDEILEIDEEIGDTVGKLRTIKRKAWANRLLGNLNIATELFEERLRIAQKTNNISQILEALQGVAIIYRDIGKWEESIARLLEYNEISNKFSLVAKHTIYNDLGFIYRKQGKFDEAIRSFKKEIELKTKQDIQTRKVWLTEIGKVYFYRGKLDQALFLYEEAFRVAQGRQKASILWKMGEVYEVQCLLTKSLEIYKESLKLIKKQNDVLRIPVLLTKIGGIYLLQGKYKLSKKTLEESLEKNRGEIHLKAITFHCLSKLYLSKGELDKAMRYIDKAIDIFDRLKAIRVAGAKLNKAKIYLKKENYQKARELMFSARNMFKKFGVPHGVAETKMLEGELIYAETGDSKEATLLISKASEVFRNLGFKLLENESAKMTRIISSTNGV